MNGKFMMFRIFMCGVIFSLCSGMWGCGLSPLDVVTADSQVLYVVNVNPAAGSQQENLSQVTVTFSDSILDESFDPSFMAVIEADVYKAYTEDWQGLWDEIKSEAVVNHTSTLSDGGNQQVVHLGLSDGLVAGTEYVVVVFPKVLSKKRYPLDQTYVGMVTPEFSSSFLINPVAIEPVEGVSSSESSAAGAYPDVTATPNEEGGSEEVVDDPIISFDWDKVLITELSTDPQQDHGESEGGNGILFDAVSGTGSVSTGDEYIEIFNGTGEVLDVSAWTLKMNDGTDVEQVLGDESWKLFLSAGGSVDALAPGEFLVLGDPDGQMNNTIGLELWDGDGVLRDSVAVEDANAGDLSDEAFYRDESGEWGLGGASLGAF